jgi:hypothetical protein
MKWFLLVLLAPMIVHGADDHSRWSSPVDGLRARLYFAPGCDPDYDYNFQVWLQFENVGRTGNLGAIREDRNFVYSVMGLKLDVTDSNGRKLPRVGPAIVEEIIPSYNLCLPFAGNLAFPIGHGWDTPPSYPASWGGVPLKPDQVRGKYFMISSDLGWIIPVASTGDFYLSGTYSFSMKESRIPVGNRMVAKYPGGRINWEGTLVLPPVKIPAP